MRACRPVYRAHSFFSRCGDACPARASELLQPRCRSLPGTMTVTQQLLPPSSALCVCSHAMDDTPVFVRCAYHSCGVAQRRVCRLVRVCDFGDGRWDKMLMRNPRLVLREYERRVRTRTNRSTPSSSTNSRPSYLRSRDFLSIASQTLAGCRVALCRLLPKNTVHGATAEPSRAYLWNRYGQWIDGWRV